MPCSKCREEADGCDNWWEKELPDKKDVKKKKCWCEYGTHHIITSERRISGIVNHRTYVKPNYCPDCGRKMEVEE